MQKFFKILSLSLGIIFFMTASYAAPAKNLWPRWETNNPTATQVINHDAYAQFLARYVTTNTDGVNTVRYKDVTPADRKLLRNYLTYLATLPIDRYNRYEQLAYWINLYNALTLEVVLEHYPVKSIKDINLSGGFFSRGPWDAKIVQVEGNQLSLNDIEHRIIRPIWNDPRTHYALNCASYSCPNLQKLPYTGAAVANQLSQAAEEYVNSQRGVNINNNKLVVSKIYDWYQDDFGGSEAAVIKHLQQYAEPTLKRQLAQFHEIDGYTYNWALDE